MSNQSSMAPLSANSTVMRSLDLKVIEVLSSSSVAKSIEEISSEAGTLTQECRRIVDDLIDIGLVSEVHDSDAYGHEIIRFRRRSRAILSFEE